MALSNLASTADLPPAWQPSPRAARALDVASAAIRDAADGPISAATGTITTPAPGGSLLSLPGPVRDVAAVTIAGEPVDDWSNLGHGLWRARGWGRTHAAVAVTATFGLPDVPADVSDLCVQLAVSWLQHDADGGGSLGGVTSVRIDDAAETYSSEAASAISPVFIPEVTRTWLAARFGGRGAVVMETL